MGVLNLKTISVEVTVYHLALGAGTVKKISDKFIIVEFINQKLKYSKQDIGLLIFDSKKEMYAHFSKSFKIPYYTVEAISNRVLMPHKLSLEYYKMFECIFENKYKRYYRFVCESLEWLIDSNCISIYSSYDSEKIKKIIDIYLCNKNFSYAIKLSICYNKDFLLDKCCKTYMSLYKNDLDKILQLFQFCLKTIFKSESYLKNRKETLFNNQHYKDDLYCVILDLILKFEAEDYLLMKLEEPYFDRLIDRLSDDMTKKSFEMLLEYFCKYHEEGDYTKLLDNLIDFANRSQEEKQYLDRFINSETKKIKEVHNSQSVIVCNTTMQLKEQLPIILRERDITELLHFTNINNIPSIIACGGLWPRSMHKELGIIAEYSDEIRLDNRLNATSLSISFPNYTMLYQKYKTHGCNYAILVLDPVLLYLENEKTFFYYKNAASTDGKFLSGCDIKSFNRLFDKRLRKNTIPQKYTTNSHAEILIEGIVDIKYIKEIHVNSIAAKEKLYCVIDDVELRNKIQVNPFYFNYENGKKIWEPEETSNGQTNIF